MNAKTATLERPIQDFASATSRGPLALVPEPAPPKAYSPKLAKALMAITREFGPIKKDGWNKFHEYHYQKWEDVLERESILLAQHGIIVQQSEVARSLLDKLISITYEFTLINEDGDFWPDRPVFTAIARLQDNKGVFDDKAANKCHTQAHKYFLLHTFKIRTKEAVEDDADAGDEVAAKQVASPKPPKPGSAEAKTLERPRSIPMQGHSAESWADAFIFAIENATLGEIDMWREENRNALVALEKYPEPTAKVKKAIAARTAALVPQNAPKPPKPGTASTPAPKSNPMPDPAEQPAEFIAWLAAKFDGFETYEAGETYWNETVEALDLAPAIQEDAMAIWQKFDARHAP